MSVPRLIAIQARKCTQSDMAQYASLTGDFNPIHLEPTFAARTPFGSPIVYGTFALVPIWEALATALGADALAGARAEVRFLQPIKVGSTPHIQGERVESTGPHINYEFTVCTEEGERATLVVVRLRKSCV